MSAFIEPEFAEHLSRWQRKLMNLGVPIEVWQEVLVEMYSPVDWSELPDAFRWLGYDLRVFGDRGVYDLSRPVGMQDHEFARGLLKQAQQRLDARNARIADAWSGSAT